MRDENTHLSDETLMLFADGELRGREAKPIREHLEACSPCRLRLRQLDEAIAEFARMHRQGDPLLPLPEGPRALLKARLHELTASPAPHVPGWLHDPEITRGVACLAVALTVVIAVLLSNRPDPIPRADLTPGAVNQVAVSDVCRARLRDNADVVPAIQQRVFAEYGVSGAEARAYEVDYLITPALGGSDDIRNLWPQPYSGSAWNAYVKDALEDELRRQVCAGQLDLPTAQHEISANWIAAYKKYFHTNRPLAAHLRFHLEDEAK